MSKTRLSIRRVAKAAGLSPTTVSRVLSGNPIPTTSTRERVMAVVRDLGYQRTRTLATQDLKPTIPPRPPHQDTGVVAIVSTMAYPGSMDHGGHHGRFMQGLHKVLDPRGYHLVWGGSIPSDGGLPEVVDSDRVDGVIIEGELSVQVRDRLCQDMPVVFSSTFLPLKVAADVVSLDIERCVVESMDYLAERGHQGLAMLMSNAGQPYHHHFCQYLQASPRATPHHLSATLDLHDGNYETVIEDFVARLKVCDPRPTGVLCMYRYAPVLVAKLQNAGLRVPEDVSVISLAERELQLVTPALTCYSWCRESVGVVAAELLLGRLEDPARVYRRVLMHGSLTERNSCAPMACR